MCSSDRLLIFSIAIRRLNMHKLYLITLFLLIQINLAISQVNIGVSLPLSGDLVEYGEAVRNGIELAKEENQEEKQGPDLNFIYEDNQYEASKAISAYNKLVKKDKVKVLFNWGEPPLHAIAPLAEQDKLPVLAMSLDPKPALNKKYIIRTINHADDYAEKLVKFFVNKGYKTIGLVHTIDPFLIAMVDGIKKYLSKDQSVTIYESYNPDNFDFKTSLLKLTKTAEKPDILGVFLFSGQVQTFYRQMHAYKLNLPTFGTDFFESRNEIKLANGTMHGAVYANIIVQDVFYKKYVDKYKIDNQIAYAYNAYQMAKLLLSIEDYKNAESILASLRGVKSKEYIYNSNEEAGSYFKFPIVIKKIEEDSFKVI